MGAQPNTEKSAWCSDKQVLQAANLTCACTLWQNTFLRFHGIQFSSELPMIYLSPALSACSGDVPTETTAWICCVALRAGSVSSDDNGGSMHAGQAAYQTGQQPGTAEKHCTMF